MHDTRLQALRHRYERLKTSVERAHCEQTWTEIAHLVQPRKVDFLGMRVPGQKNTQHLYDATGVHALEMLAAGLHGMATNPASRWFTIRLIGALANEQGQLADINENPTVRAYLHDVEHVLWQRMYAPGTNFTTALHECYLDLSAFGTGIMYVGQQANGQLLFECRSLAECVVAENTDGKIDTVFRRSTYTVRQMMQLKRTLGWTVSDAVEDKYRNDKFEDEVVVLHVVDPREERDATQIDEKNMPVASCYFELETCHKLQESGYPNMPFLVARWSKYANETYGRGPGHIALPDLKMLQAMALSAIKVVHKTHDPSYGLNEENLLGPARMVPGGMTYFRGNPRDSIMTIPIAPQGAQIALQYIQQLREMILRTFYADLMRITDRPNMTATEVVQRTQEMMRLFGPLVGRLESELLGPLITLVFEYCMRNGLLPPAPEELQGMDFSIEFVSPIATAQRQSQYSGIAQVMQLLAMFGPDVAAQIVQRQVDVGQLFEKIWMGFGNDPDVLRTSDELAEIEQMERAQQMAQMADQAMSPVAQGAQAMRDVSQANAMSGTGGGQPAFNVSQLVSQFQSEMQNNPQAQQDLYAAMGADDDMLLEEQEF